MDTVRRPLRICFCLSCFYPVESGAERQARLQAEELVRRGHQVFVFTSRQPGCPARQRKNGVLIWRLIQPRPGGPLFGATFLYSLRSSLIRHAERFDLIHCHQGLWEAAAAGWAAPVHRKPIVVQPAASGPFGEYTAWRNTRGRQVLRRWILRAHCFVALSDEIYSEWLSFGVPAAKLVRLASGVDVAHFCPGPSPLEDRLPPRPRVVYVGRLHPQKDLPTLLRAWAHVQRQYPSHLLLVGAGPEQKHLQELARQLKIEPSVHWVGPTSDVLPYLRAADLFVLPSLAEGMSNALLEAMATGLPCVVSDIGGNRDLIEHGRTGLLFRPGDAEHLAQLLCQILPAADHRRYLGEAARRHVCQHYSLAAIADRYEELYRSLIGQNPQP
jgi:glycosyltransferase involved in cell wall biosynthesis